MSARFGPFLCVMHVWDVAKRQGYCCGSTGASWFWLLLLCVPFSVLELSFSVLARSSSHLQLLSQKVGSQDGKGAYLWGEETISETLHFAYALYLLPSGSCTLFSWTWKLPSLGVAMHSEQMQQKRDLFLCVNVWGREFRPTFQETIMKIIRNTKVNLKY